MTAPESINTLIARAEARGDQRLVIYLRVWLLDVLTGDQGRRGRVGATPRGHPAPPVRHSDPLSVHASRDLVNPAEEP